MQYALSIVEPPQGAAGYGKVKVIGPIPEHAVFRRIYWALRERDAALHPDVANKFASEITRKEIGTGTTEPSTGLSVYLHKVTENDEPPHPCPCCGRLVLPDAHAYAGSEDAYCTGCFTWDRNVPACLPKNTAHATREESCG